VRGQNTGSAYENKGKMEKHTAPAITVNQKKSQLIQEKMVIMIYVSICIHETYETALLTIDYSPL
jgi:hypothetical protein